jgi:hypothetical protein
VTHIGLPRLEHAPSSDRTSSDGEVMAKVRLMT